MNGAIAAGAEAAIIPEFNTEVDQLEEFINNGFRKSKSSSIVLVAESEITGGAMHYAERVKNEYPQYDVRVTILGHLQRGGRPTGTRPYHCQPYGSSQHPGPDGRSAQRHDWYRKRPDCVRSVCQGYQERQAYRPRTG